MIAPQEMLPLKQRMLVAADAAYRIASSSEPFVMHDQEQYELVMNALLSLTADVRRLLAEHDILRGMFAEKLGAFFMEGMSDGRTGSAEDVPRMPNNEGGDRGEAPRNDPPSVAGDVLGVPPARKRTRRSNPKGHRKGYGKAAGELESGGGEIAVDGSQDA